MIGKYITTTIVCVFFIFIFTHLYMKDYSSNVVYGSGAENNSCLYNAARHDLTEVVKGKEDNDIVIFPCSWVFEITHAGTGGGLGLCSCSHEADVVFVYFYRPGYYDEPGYLYYK